MRADDFWSILKAVFHKTLSWRCWLPLEPGLFGAGWCPLHLCVLTARSTRPTVSLGWLRQPKCQMDSSLSPKINFKKSDCFWSNRIQWEERCISLWHLKLYKSNFKEHQHILSSAYGFWIEDLKPSVLWPHVSLYLGNRTSQWTKLCCVSYWLSREGLINNYLKENASLIYEAHVFMIKGPSEGGSHPFTDYDPNWWHRGLPKHFSLKFKVRLLLLYL